ncbi:NAD(P)-dependent oxidoreductase [Streptomyces sp. NPDC091217]|uniref:NAD(P)-dependent oxidoreductase n=1 Tax=Streptomyces sp. NPDC091217 TaxID=3365975 RepID=UPI003800FE6A
MLAAARNLPVEERSMSDGGWQLTLGTWLHGKTLGLLGLGNLGGRVARIGQAFGMNTIAWSQNLTPERAAEYGGTAVGKHELFAAADVLSVHLVLSDHSRGLVGRAELDAMKPSAILVNTSRGPINDQDALSDTLRHQAIRCAALDVYDIEPLPSDHPLRESPNTVLTPHTGYVTRELYEIFYGDAVEDIAAFQAGQPIRVATA